MKREFEIGDLVRVRDWEDMAAEYGTKPGTTYINCPYWVFTDRMRDYCGMVFTVSEKVPRVHTLCYNGSGNEHIPWRITGYMLEAAEIPADDFGVPEIVWR